MKYLKKIFENNLMLDTNILGDILQEITDLGYLSHVNSSWWSDDRGNGISVCIYGKNEYDKQFNCEVGYIYPDEVMEVIERLIDFLGSEGYKPYDKDKKEINNNKKITDFALEPYLNKVDVIIKFKPTELQKLIKSCDIEKYLKLSTESNSLWKAKRKCELLDNIFFILFLNILQ